MCYLIFKKSAEWSYGLIIQPLISRQERQVGVTYRSTTFQRTYRSTYRSTPDVSSLMTEVEVFAF